MGAIPGCQGHTLRTKLGGEGLVASLLQDEHRLAVQDEFVFDGDDELAVQRPQGLGFVMQPGVVVLVQGDLEDKLLVVPGDQQGGRSRPLAKNPVHDKAVLKPVAPFGVQRIDDDGLCRCGEFIFDIVQQRQEIFDRADAGEHVLRSYSPSGPPRNK
jgi:hypothetical protein